MIGEVIGNYRIVSELGKGGMGVVYLADHVQLGRPAALKMLLPQLSSDPAIVQRFFNEARAASAIDHPGIVEIYDFGTHTDGRAYIVMALLKGESLDTRLGLSAMHPIEAANICAQVAAALAAAHARGIVHRDLKPDNIFLVPNELMPGGIQVKLLDFGIAKLADEQQAGHRTQTGTLIGTPAYMSPEQCMGRSDLDHRTDLYSLGCILFHLLCGRPPFTSEHGTGVMIAAHLRDAAPDPRSLNAGVPPQLAAIVTRLLEKDPAARFQTATEVRQALVAGGAVSPVTRPPVEPYGATVSLSPVTVKDRGAAAYGRTATPTTQSGSAAQLVAARDAAPRGNKAAFVVVGLLLAAVGGAGIYAATRGSGSTTPASQPGGDLASGAPLPATPLPADDRARPPIAPAPPTAPGKPVTPSEPTIPPPAPAATLDCPPGQVRGDDTRGHCCWPAQAWSTAKAQCVGKPTCPKSMTAHGEDCIASGAGSTVGANGGTTGTSGGAGGASTVQGAATTAPAFSLSATAYDPEAAIAITFAAPVASPATSRTWVAVAEVGKPPSAYEDWKFVSDGSTTASLTAPKPPGSYEVRLHTEYPAKSFNVVRAVPFTVKGAGSGSTPDADLRIAVSPSKVPAGANVTIKFKTAMHALPGERFWVTIVSAGEAASTWGKYDYVADGARTMTLAAPDQPGSYEVRLHSRYPKLTTHVVFSAKLEVTN